MYVVALHEINFRHLVALDAVATEGTFARAAERLGYTQSAVSQQIAGLERIIGDRVFDRPKGPRAVTLTPLGEHLLAHGRELLAKLSVLGDDLAQFRQGAVGRLRVGTFQSVSTVMLPLLAGPMRARHPDLDLSVYDSDYDDQLHERLAAGELDLSFVVGEVDERFDARHLMTDPFCLLSRPGQFPSGPVSIHVLNQEPLIGQHHNSCQILNEAGLRSRGVEPNYVFRSNDNGAVAAMVRAGMGVAVLPLLCVEPDDPRIEIHPLEPTIPGREISIAWRAGRTRSPAADQFIELAVEVAAELAERMAAIPGFGPATVPA